jgi:DNA polymerase-1
VKGAVQVKRRVIIVDFNHMVHTYFHSNHRLSVKVNQGGIIMDKDTTIQSGCIKSIHRWSNGGVNPTAVCFDRPVPARKYYWQSKFSDMKVGSGNEYKGGRERMADAMFQGSSDCELLMSRAGIACYARPNYEADDLVYACIKRAKELYPGTPIDVITNDADLLPLVDDTVSVFIRSKKGTWAESKDLEKPHYIQVTPKNYQTIVEDMSAYKGFCVPYNTLLLHKLLRGDSSDQFKRSDISKMFSPKKYNAFIQRLIDDDINLPEIFRYGDPRFEIFNSVTGQVWAGTREEALSSPERANLKQRVIMPEELECILEVLRRYTELSEEQLDAVASVYTGMNLNQVYVGNSPETIRRSFVINDKCCDIKPFSEIELQKAIMPLQIRLNIR